MAVRKPKLPKKAKGKGAAFLSGFKLKGAKGKGKTAAVSGFPAKLGKKKGKPAPYGKKK